MTSVSLQVISDSIIINILESLRRLQVLAICHCLGDLSISSFKLPLPNLRKLKLERVTPWMTNNDLVILTQNCSELVELSLVGCTLLSSGRQLSFVNHSMQLAYSVLVFVYSLFYYLFC